MVLWGRERVVGLPPRRCAKRPLPILTQSFPSFTAASACCFTLLPAGKLNYVKFYKRPLRNLHLWPIFFSGGWEGLPLGLPPFSPGRLHQYALQPCLCVPLSSRATPHPHPAPTFTPGSNLSSLWWRQFAAQSSISINIPRRSMPCV